MPLPGMFCRYATRGLKALAAVGVGTAGLTLTAQAAGPSKAFEMRFAPLYATVFTEGGTFGGSAMSADLQALEPLLQQPGIAARDVFRLYYTEASVYARRGMPREAAAAASKALAAMPQPASTELAYPHFFLRHSSIRWLADSGQYDAALQLVRSFQARYPLQSIASLPAEMRWDPDHPVPQARDFPSQLQILGVYEDEGYVLHEQGKYREARQANARLLPVSRERLKALGMPQRLRGVLTNIAQNCYELGELDQARAYLQERLQIALAAQDDTTVYDSYFQLMVLAHEQKQAGQARQWLARYARHAQMQRDGEQLARARELQAELDNRQSKRKSSADKP
jgi:tetratricopeptide (TPR) repeat protein